MKTIITLMLCATTCFTEAAVKRVSDGKLKALITGEFEHHDGIDGGLPFWIYGGKSLRKGKEYPLIIALHGRRNNVKPGSVFKPQSMATCWTKESDYKKRPCFVIQPYYPPKSGWKEDQEGLIKTIQFAFENLPIDRSRVYLTGFSNGGQGTLMMLAAKPEWFAGALTISGPTKVEEVVGKIKAPIWMWVGEKDFDLNKVGRVTEIAEALKASGHPIRFNVVPGAGHACHSKAYGNRQVHEWLFDQNLK
ncbi:MAG: prolyl oligopeptidase family serine peptidase [Kiritimatiellales bacterium]|nr:prolyl oligopeptidase family serine peptidase [Kiritimatiellales bacterium]